jgi:hypothetical protein
LFYPFISVFGGAILRFALSLFVLDVTGRADVFATVLAISSVPVLFAPIGGAKNKDQNSNT